MRVLVTGGAGYLGSRFVPLSLHPPLSDKNIHEVVEALKKVLAHSRK